MTRNILLALAVLCGISAATVAVAGFTASSASACDYSKTS